MTAFFKAPVPVPLQLKSDQCLVSIHPSNQFRFHLLYDGLADVIAVIVNLFRQHPDRSFATLTPENRY